ncbi:ribosomal protein L5 domain-containing protein [Fimicolochytrium jonesii]|uniref:ribosomal protein L5 domain-containing protein n=1 Tax=Fimicolochytrium jonesii TaxID=1396493 RepID=UPI0022FE16C1|nr:ribosomal protein L5 domain-containing protein [Fimicolochytrium jonesii]KAI8826169.1 ribosomal protein L5 domain-containing protein [Fimicolochytrium jonesii]
MASIARGCKLRSLPRRSPIAPFQSSPLRSFATAVETPSSLSDTPAVPPPAPEASPSPQSIPVSRPRLEEHYYNSLLEDLLVLTYDHSSAHASLSHLATQKEWQRSLPPNPLQALYSVKVEQLPTYPGSDTVTNLLTLENAKVKEVVLKRVFRRGSFNPIDYTTVAKERLFRREDAPPPPPYSPLPSRVPIVSRVVLRIWDESAVQNKMVLLSAIMSLQAISGVRAEPIFATAGDAAKKIRAGMPLGAQVELRGVRMYEFLDKLTQTVLPRLREWNGINPVGDDNGSITLRLPGPAVGYFPDIEPHFDMYPKLFDTDIVVQTTGKSDWETVMCLSGFQIPFLEERVVAKEKEEADSNDPWAKFRKPKTREERQAMAEKAKKAGSKK